jgi:hypothetical protein
MASPAATSGTRFQAKNLALNIENVGMKGVAAICPSCNMTVAAVPSVHAAVTGRWLDGRRCHLRPS